MVDKKKSFVKWIFLRGDAYVAVFFGLVGLGLGVFSGLSQNEYLGPYAALGAGFCSIWAGAGALVALRDQWKAENVAVSFQDKQEGEVWKAGTVWRAALSSRSQSDVNGVMERLSQARQALAGAKEESKEALSMIADTSSHMGVALCKISAISNSNFPFVDKDQPESLISPKIDSTVEKAKMAYAEARKLAEQTVNEAKGSVAPQSLQERFEQVKKIALLIRDLGVETSNLKTLATEVDEWSGCLVNTIEEMETASLKMESDVILLSEDLEKAKDSARQAAEACVRAHEEADEGLAIT